MRFQTLLTSAITRAILSTTDRPIKPTREEKNGQQIALYSFFSAVVISLVLIPVVMKLLPPNPTGEAIEATRKINGRLATLDDRVKYKIALETAEQMVRKIPDSSVKLELNQALGLYKKAAALEESIGFDKGLTEIIESTREARIHLDEAQRLYENRE
jgi:hypothetical protein